MIPPLEEMERLCKRLQRRFKSHVSITLGVDVYSNDTETVAWKLYIGSKPSVYKACMTWEELKGEIFFRLMCQ